MRKNFIAAASIAISTLAFAAPASAAVTIGSITPGTDPYSGPVPTYTFEPGSIPAFSGGGVVGPGTSSGLYAQPYGSTGQYYSVGPSTSSPGTIDLTSFGAITSLSLLWGSVDAYNTLEFLGADGTTVLQAFTGSDIFNPADGNQTDPNTNPVVTFLLSGGDENAFSYLRLTSQTNAFEIDNIAINPAVPEPATWGMMLLGFGAMGMAFRRSRKAKPIAQFA